MKLSKIILPEIVLGRRGDKTAISLYQTLMKQCEYGDHPDGSGKAWKLPSPEAEGFKGDANFAMFVLAMRIFRDRNGKVYYLGKDFAQALAGIDRDLPIEYLPTSFVGYIQFAENAFIDDTGPVDGAFIWIGNAEEIGITVGLPEGKAPKDVPSILIVYGDRGSIQGCGPDAVSNVRAILDNKTMTSICAGVRHQDSPMLGHRTRTPEQIQALRVPIYRAVINAILYCMSAEPEMLKLRPLGELTNSKRSEEKRKLAVHNETTIPITLLHWGYKRERESHVDSTFVQTHMRWQRCGTNCTQIKLVWVKAHERRFKPGLTTQIGKIDVEEDTEAATNER